MFHVRRRRQQFEEAQSLPPAITSFLPDPVPDAPGPFWVVGLRFGPAQGSGKVYLGNASTYSASTILTEQCVGIWEDSAISGTAVVTGLGNEAWAYVLTGAGLVNAVGRHVFITWI